MAGLDGIEAAPQPGRSPLRPKDIYALTPEELRDVPKMPGSLDEALEELESATTTSCSRATSSRGRHRDVDRVEKMANEGERDPPECGQSLRVRALLRRLSGARLGARENRRRSGARESPSRRSRSQPDARAISSGVLRRRLLAAALRRRRRTALHGGCRKPSSPSRRPQRSCAAAIASLIFAHDTAA